MTRVRPSRLLAVAFVCLLPAVAPIARAAPTRAADIPACEEVLTAREAGVAMAEPIAFILNRQVRGLTRVCAYAGGVKGAPKLGHGLGVNWGPYSDVRKRTPALANAQLCPVDVDACRDLKLAVKVTPDRRSFTRIAEALAQVGRVRTLPAAGFNGSPAFLWLPGRELSASLIDKAAWVLVYDPGSASMLQVLCSDTAAEEPDAACAVSAARRAYANVA